ncbi:MAG TPA: GNAT family N-acetyltransferase [Candidatus Dormibacteraeota bacterium]|jgi:GNAT superfamily N-acetyltransferase
MPAVSQALIEFARHHRTQAGPGVEVTVTPRYEIVLQPDFPIPGPNNVSWIRCRPDEVAEVIREGRAAFAPHHQAFMWLLDPETEPPDFGDNLVRSGIHWDGDEAAVMVLPIDATVEAHEIPGLEILDGLADLETFRKADAVNAEAFKSALRGDDPQLVAMQERRRLNFVAAGNRRLLLATMDGEPAGSAGLTLFPPAAAILNGGAVREKFRGRGIYHAMVAERLKLAHDAGVEGGLTVWGGHMSAPILAELGFEKVGWRRFYLDTSTA